MNLIDWVATYIRKPDHNAELYLAKSGLLEGLKWIYEKHSIIAIFDILRVASMCGRIEILEWLLSIDSSYFNSNNIEITASMHGNLDVLKWLYNNNLLKSVQTCIYGAANNGQLHVIVWLMELEPINLDYDTEERLRIDYPDFYYKIMLANY